MPRLLREDYINLEPWERWFREEIKAIYVVNKSKTILYVFLDNLASVSAVDPGKSVLYPIAKESVRVTIRYYTKDRDMQDLCTNNLLNNGRCLRVVDQ